MVNTMLLIINYKYPVFIRKYLNIFKYISRAMETGNKEVLNIGNISTSITLNFVISDKIQDKFAKQIIFSLINTF